MKPRLSTKALSLAFATATVAACSGGASTGQMADKNTSAFREGLPPAIRDGDKLAVTDGNADYMLALRSAALKLTGNYPTQTEIAELQNAADQPTTYAARIDEYMSRPAFAAQQVQFWRDTFKMGGNLTVQVGAGTATVSLETAPTLAAQLVVSGQPFNNIVTQTKGTCPTFNATNGMFTAGDCTNTGGQPVVGVLTDAGVQAQFMSSMAFRRARWVQETFMCSRYPAETNGPAVAYAGGTYSSPWPITSITGAMNIAKAKIDFHDTSAVICANCHTTMNHIAPLLAKFDVVGNLTNSIQVITPVPPNAISDATDWLPNGEGYAWRLNKPIANLTDLGAAVSADPQMSVCVASRMWNWAMSRGDVVNDQVVITPELSARLASKLVQNSWNVKELVRQIFNDPNFVRY